jgi:uncharacterized membrane protein YphA (DoxX/SURF4 family)
VELVAALAAAVVGLSFVIAGGSKLAAKQVWPDQARGLGAPSWTIPIVPWLELVLGAALIVQLARRPSAAIALVLLSAFTALIVNQLRQGLHPPCACFGAWSASPIGRRHLIRNAFLLALAAIAMI